MSLVERLRRAYVDPRLCKEVATELERLNAENERLRGLIEPTEANVERVARALCRNDCESNPDDLLGRITGDPRKYVWELYIEDATAALNALDPET